MTVRICSRAVSTGTPLSWLPSRKRKLTALLFMSSSPTMRMNGTLDLEALRIFCRSVIVGVVDPATDHLIFRGLDEAGQMRGKLVGNRHAEHLHGANHAGKAPA